MIGKKKLFSRILALTLAGSILPAIPIAAKEAEFEDEAVFVEEQKQNEQGNVCPTGGIGMYRLYNPNSGEHFYTSSAGEKSVLVSIGWNLEGFGWNAAKDQSVPVYRLYNANAGDHHYTTSKAERDHLLSVGWRDEGIGWYSDPNQGIILYREYNPNAKAGAHNYTTSLNEHKGLIKAGWRDEGTAWYGETWNWKNRSDIWNEFLTSKAYRKWTSATVRNAKGLEYTVMDYDADGSTELYLRFNDGMGFGFNWLFSLDANQQPYLVDSCYGFAPYQYCRSKNLILVPNEFKNAPMLWMSNLAAIENGKLVSKLTVVFDNGQYKINDKQVSAAEADAARANSQCDYPNFHPVP